MKNTFRKIAIGLGLVIATITAHADLVTPLVSLQENVINDESGNWLMNQYVVTNNSTTKDDHIYAFGVTNPAAMSAWTTLEGWTATTMSKAEWNIGFTFKVNWNVNSHMTTGNGNGNQNSSSGDLILGSFESLFGTEEEFVNFYWVQSGTPLYINDTSDEFYFSAAPASQYAAFGQFGTTFQSFNNVPEPGSIALLGLAALAGLTVSRRRRAH